MLVRYLLSPGALLAGCAVSEHNTVLHQGVGEVQLVTEWVVDSSSDPCFVFVLAQNTEPQEKFPTSNLRAWYFLSPQTQTVHVIQASLSVGSSSSHF